MRYALVLFIVGAGVLHGVAKADSVGCYQFGNITQCSNGVSAYQFGNITQIQTPQQPIQTPAIQPIQPIVASSNISNQYRFISHINLIDKEKPHIQGLFCIMRRQQLVVAFCSCSCA